MEHDDPCLRYDTHWGDTLLRKKSTFQEVSFPPVCTGATHKGAAQQGHTEVSHPPCIPWLIFYSHPLHTHTAALVLGHPCAHTV